jgi:hypothetical protein
MATLNGITFTGTGALTLPSGTTAQRPSQASTLASFTTVGTTSWTCPAGVYSVEVLVVAGGGGGGRHSGGGGGGGGGGGAKAEARECSGACGRNSSATPWLGWNA